MLFLRAPCLGDLTGQTGSILASFTASAGNVAQAGLTGCDFSAQLLLSPLLRCGLLRLLQLDKASTGACCELRSSKRLLGVDLSTARGC